MIIKINGLGHNKTYKVIENMEHIKWTLTNIDIGKQKFLCLHDFETGDPIIVSPASCVSIEIKSESEDKEE